MKRPQIPIFSAAKEEEGSIQASARPLRGSAPAPVAGSGPRLLGGRRSSCAARRPCDRMLLMNILDLETEALKLPVVERARLAETLLKSLDALSEEEHRRIWTEEAARRDAELDADPTRGRQASDVFRDAQARLR